MTGDAELVTGDPRLHNLLLGISPLGLFFTGVEARGAISRDVTFMSGQELLSPIKSCNECFEKVLAPECPEFLISLGPPKNFFIKNVQ